MDDTGLSRVLSEFARTLTTDFPIQAILDHLVKRIVEVLPISAAGVTLISANAAPHYIAASDDSALRFERLQTEMREGPCLLAYSSGEAVAAPDLAFDARFPKFGPSAVQGGLAAVFTFPLRHAQGRLGALDLYRDSAGDLSDHDMVSAQTLADVTTAYLLSAQARDEARATSDRFRHGALHDSLTGLPNRALLHERLDHAASGLPGPTRPPASSSLISIGSSGSTMATGTPSATSCSSRWRNVSRRWCARGTR